MLDPDQEEWRAFPKWEGLYEVSSRGRVKCIAPPSAPGRSRLKKDGLKKLTADNTPQHYGRLYVRLLHTDSSGRRRAQMRFVSRSVCEAFHGPPPSSRHEAAHNDGDVTNNHYTNLRWATHLENMGDRVLHGTLAAGERHGRARLTEIDALNIGELYRLGFPSKDIAKLWGVSEPYPGYIFRGSRWSHLKRRNAWPLQKNEHGDTHV